MKRIEDLEEKIIDLETHIDSLQIQINDLEIDLDRKVSRNEVISAINISEEGIRIKGSKIIIDGHTLKAK